MPLEVSIGTGLMAKRMITKWMERVGSRIMACGSMTPGLEGFTQLIR